MKTDDLTPPKKKRRTYKKSVSRRKEEIRKKTKASFRELRPRIIVEIPLTDKNPPVVLDEGKILVSVQWPDNGVKRSQPIELPKETRRHLIARVKKTYSDLVRDELHSRISREYKSEGLGSYRMRFGKAAT